jgi:small GTP-binding protein
MSDTFSFDVFLSHNKADKPRVQRLAERLKAKGLRVWLDDWIIKPGDDIYLAVEQGLQATRVLVLCMSQDALGSGWVGLERSTVLFRDPSNAGRRFIPLLLADCELPDTLRRYKYVDYRKETDADFEELLTACRGGDEESVVPPKKPKRAFPGLLDSILPKRREGKATVKPAKSENKVKQEKTSGPAHARERSEPLTVLERTLTGHKGVSWINSVAVSPDGAWAASGAEDNTVRIWDLETGDCRATLKGHREDVRRVSISPDGTQLASGSKDGSIILWDIRNNKPRTIWSDHKHEIHHVSFSSDSNRVFSVGNENTVRWWDINTGQCIKTIGVDSAWYGCAISHDGRLAVIGGNSGLLSLWDLERSTRLSIIRAHSDSVNSVQVTSDWRYAVSGSNDKTIKIHNLQTGACVGSLEGHETLVRGVAIESHSTVIASAGFTDNTVRLWEWKSGTCLQIVTSKEIPYSLAFSPDGLRLVVGTTNGVIQVYRLTGRFAALPAETTRRYVNAKVVLIGESTVGKTTLAHRLIEDRYVKTESTHGMNVSRLDLPLESNDTIEREALLWDLAGQEDYRLIHQLYLEETALALLLINPQKDDPFTEAGDWLKGLRAAATAHDNQREVAKLLIPTRLDVGGMKVSERKIDRFLKDHDFAAVLPTSAKRGDNCSDKANDGQPSKLKQLIAQHIPWDRLPWTSTPRLLAEIKNAVIAMRDKADIRLLRFAELAQRLEYALPKEKIGEADVRTAVTLLANHGLARPLKFGDLVLLRPDLLNGYAAAIIRAARAHKDEIGCVVEEAIYSDDFDFTGVERLEQRADEELLLRALVQTLLDYSLCIREIVDGKTLLIFPSQYRRDRDIPGYPEIFVTYTFTGELQTIYATLVVRLWYSRTFDQKELWQNAAEFTTSKGRPAGVLFEKLGDGEGKLSIFFDTAVPDELKVVFIEFVHRHLQKYGRDLQRERRYVCPNTQCSEPVTNYTMVRKRLDAGKDFITCQNCDGPVPFKDHIEERLASDPVARQVVAMDERATQELDTQALEQILTGHMQAICGEANQIFRELTKFDYGIDGEVEFKDDAGKASGKKIYVQLKSGGSYLRERKRDHKEIFDVKDARHLEYWVNQPVDVYLVIRDAEETIRWMNLTRYLKDRTDKGSRQIVFEGEKLDFEAIWRVRDGFFPQPRVLRKAGRR